MGKTFQTELSMKQLGVQAVVMSAGELEHEWAGTPARLIRERYRWMGSNMLERERVCVASPHDTLKPDVFLTAYLQPP